MKSLAKNLFLSLILFTSLAISSCEKDGTTFPPRPLPTATSCSTYGTLVKVSCGVSVLNNYWIKLDNGKYLQPCESDVINKRPLDLREGMRIKFGYTAAKPGNFCETAITCMLALPPTNPIKITCLELPPVGGCKYNGVIVYNDKVMKPCNPKVIKLDNGTFIEPVNQELLTSFKDGDQVSVSYNIVQTFAVPCSGYGAVELTCLNGNAVTKPCKSMLVGDDPKYGQAEVQINSAVVEGNCLKLNVGFSGCDDHIDRFELLWDGSLMKNSYIHANLVLLDKNPQMCQAYFTKTLSFDLSELRKMSSGKLNLGIVGWNQTFQY